MHSTIGRKVLMGLTGLGLVGFSLVHLAGNLLLLRTGLILFAFLVWHLWAFKFGAGVEAGYSVQVDGRPIRDLHRLVVESFRQEWFTGLYVLVMVLLGREQLWNAWSTSPTSYRKFTIIGTRASSVN